MKAPGPAGLLFALRIFPLTFSVLVAIFFTLPSFWLMERKAFDEDATTFLLAGLALLLLIAGVVRVLRAKIANRAGSEQNGSEQSRLG